MAYERMGDVLKDNDFLDVTIMTINAEEVPKEYQNHSMHGWHEVFS
jgi:hypothetical protein